MILALIGHGGQRKKEDSGWLGQRRDILEMNERAVLTIFSLTVFIGIGVIGVVGSNYTPAKSVANLQAEDANYKLSSSGVMKTVAVDRVHELSGYSTTADLILFINRCDASSISAEGQKVIIGKFDPMPNANLREEAMETERKRIEAMPAHENLPGGWVSFCKIMSDKVAQGVYDTTPWHGENRDND